MKASFRRIALTFAAVVGVLVLIGGGCVWWYFARPLPSDASLSRLFHEHRSDLDRLAAMALADTQLVGAGMGHVYVRDTPTSNHRLTDAEVRASGREELCQLLRRVGLPGLSRDQNGSRVWFVIVSSHHGHKGLVYSLEPPEPLLRSLDGSEYGYASLAPPWFLFSDLGD